MAAVLREVGKKIADAVGTQRVDDAATFPAERDELGAGEFLQVEGERVGCDVEVMSEISRRRSLRADPHKVAEDLQACRLREGCKTGNSCN